MMQIMLFWPSKRSWQSCRSVCPAWCVRARSLNDLIAPKCQILICYQRRSTNCLSFRSLRGSERQRCRSLWFSSRDHGPAWCPRRRRFGWPSCCWLFQKCLRGLCGRLWASKWGVIHIRRCFFQCSEGTHLCIPRSKTSKSCIGRFRRPLPSLPWIGSTSPSSGSAPAHKSHCTCRGCIRSHQALPFGPCSSTCILL